MQLEPMLAAAGRKAFDDPEWSFELEYAGFRALLFLDASGARFISERGSNLTKRLPELEEIRIPRVSSLVLDGEIIAGNGNIASYRGLIHRYAKSGITALKPKDRVSLKYVASDVLLLNGQLLINEPLKRRQDRLRKLLPKSAGMIVRAKTVIGRGIGLLDEAQSRGFKGILAKRVDSPYEPGKRSKSWLRFKTKTAT